MMIRLIRQPNEIYPAYEEDSDILDRLHEAQANTNLEFLKITGKEPQYMTAKDCVSEANCAALITMLQGRFK